MKKTVLTFGLISGFILAAMLAAMVPLMSDPSPDFEHGEIVGYTSMVLAFLMVFFGIRSYRDNVAGGSITFGKAFTVGILITVVSCVIYVVAWQIIYFNFIPDFGDRYAAHQIEKMRTDGATAEAIEKARIEMARFKELYANPLFNAAITFIEPLPVGLIMTLVSAGILRGRRAGVEPPSPAAG